MADFNTIQILAISALPILFAITLHEVAHGWMALKLGDRTAQMLGRLTLNPLKHIDLVGTVIVPMALLVMSQGTLIFGWAKPVPVTTRNFSKPRRDMALVSLAGPLANLLMALVWALITRISSHLISDETVWYSYPLLLMGERGVIFNLVLMVLNLLPIPPLDGSRVAGALLPGPLAYRMERAEVVGPILLLVLFATGLLQQIVQPMVLLCIRLISSIFGL